ncbi:hypothetical protein ALC56_14057 [Trachymyrmex septentrionalis]|uniref:Uncharacterized protein n=1 Tax=Trachymyrmex septentrionalis TaxID=34720 RepID=A0A151JT86_9HYME|nr:hypothetical protein ALC56_14057 [Trachymyrmex septentrionalis]
MSQAESGRAGYCVACMYAKCVQNFNENHWRSVGKLLDHMTAQQQPTPRESGKKKGEVPERGFHRGEKEDPD